MPNNRELTRRQLVKGCVGSLVSVALPQARARAGQGPPPFQTARYQFTLLRAAHPVPPIPIPRLVGRPISLTSFRGKVVLVNFWATWCPACRTELPMLDQLTDALRDGPFEIVAVSVDQERRTAVEPFVRSMKLHRLAVGLDPGGLVSRAGAELDSPFALYGMPISYVVGATGRVEGYIAGAADWLSGDARRLLDYYAATGTG